MADTLITVRMGESQPLFYYKPFSPVMIEGRASRVVRVPEKFVEKLDDLFNAFVDAQEVLRELYITRGDKRFNFNWDSRDEPKTN